MIESCVQELSEEGSLQLLSYLCKHVQEQKALIHWIHAIIMKENLKDNKKIWKHIEKLKALEVDH